jgi:hypothetical protein
MPEPTIREIPRDVLRMLRVELRQAEAGRWELLPDKDGVDINFVEMLRETIARIERLEKALRIIAGEQKPFDNLLGNADLARIALHGR